VPGTLTGAPGVVRVKMFTPAPLIVTNPGTPAMEPGMPAATVGAEVGT
jgi:hypothetical protein